MNDPELRDPTMQLDIRQIVYALSDTVDLVDGHTGMHGKRVAYMASTVADGLGWSRERVDELFLAGLLHDGGLASTRAFERQLNDPDGSDPEVHCVAGAELVGDLPPFAHLAPLVRAHHTPWNRLGRLPLGPEQREQANLLLIADRLDGALAKAGLPTPPREGGWLEAEMASWPEGLCSPGLARAFRDRVTEADFPQTLAAEDLSRWLTRRRHELPAASVDLRGFCAIAEVFSRIVDAKSPYTAHHSPRVARLALHFAERLGFGEHDKLQLKAAALLHDIGKLRIPDEIVDKPAPLTKMERAIVRRHSYDTAQILGRIRGLGPVARWAGAHHETLEGGGYPFSLLSKDLPLEARVLAVADVFQALAQARPYRDGLNPDAIVDHLMLQADKGLLDADLVAMAAADRRTCYELAAEGCTPPPAARISQLN